MIPMTPDMGSV